MVDSVEVKRSKTILLLLLGLYSPRALFAQKQTGGAEIIAYPIEKTRSGELRKASKVDAKQVCRKYEGRYIGYYGKLYKVEGCKRRKVASQKLRFKIETPVEFYHHVLFLTLKKKITKLKNITQKTQSDYYIFE